MKTIKIVSDFLGANVFVVKDKCQCIIIDCGVNVNAVKKAVGKTKVAGILLTHGHYDHSRYCLKYAKQFGCKIFAHQNVIKTMQDPKIMYSLGNFIIDDFSDFCFLNYDQKLKLGDFDIDCYYCPGHTDCCECYLINGQLFAGDVLFDKTIGRTDLVNSNEGDMLNSLLKLKNVDFEIVYSGHGEESNHEEQLKNIAIFKEYLTN